MSFKFRFSKGELLKLFLVCAAPVHFWTIFLIITDSELIKKRDFWYFAGYGGYLLGLALLESLLLFVFVLGLSYLFPKKWTGNTPLAAAAAIALVISFWGIANQLYFYLLEYSPGWFLWLMPRVYYHQRLAYNALVAVVTLSIALPVYFLSQSEKTRDAVLPVLENLSLLSYMYLGLDLLGLVVVLLRNLY